MSTTSRIRPLTDWDREILILKANGYTSKEAAVKMNTTHASIDCALSVIFVTLGVRNCAQAIAVTLKSEEISMDRIEATRIHETNSP